MVGTQLNKRGLEARRRHSNHDNNTPNKIDVSKSTSTALTKETVSAADLLKSSVALRLPAA
jgi:hypothetical protein